MDYDVELDDRPGTGQQEEALVVTWGDGRSERMRLHEYGRVYAIPGLYEEVVQRRLACLSPTTLAEALVAEVRRRGEDPAALAALDLGAGNGVVGEELRAHGVRGALVGMDTEPAAGPAAERDRPGLYTEYLTGDLADLDLAAVVERHGLNALVGAGALGLGHVSAEGFDRAWRTFPAGAWLAVTVSGDVLEPSNGDLAEYVAQLREGAHGTEVVHLRPFPHRLRMSGEPIEYHVLVARRTG